MSAEAARTAGSAGLGIPPGVLFFLGGLLVLTAIVTFQYVLAE